MRQSDEKLKRYEYVRIYEEEKPEPSPKPIKLSKTYIKALEKKKKERMDSLMHSWGAYTVPCVSLRSSMENIGNNDVLEQSDGYDCALITDHDSLMIQISMIVSELHLVDSKLLRYHYQGEYKDPQARWMNEFKRESKTYHNKRPILLLKIANKLGL